MEGLGQLVGTVAWVNRKAARLFPPSEISDILAQNREPEM
jgi:hypothetical protein